MARVLVLRSAGTNCDEETAYAFRLAGADVESVHVGALLGGERSLEEFHVLAFPGGFSYGDDLGAGTVLASRLEHRLRGPLEDFVASGRLVLGICNGFQVLVRLGLLPLWPGEKCVSLVENTSGKFEDRWVSLRIDRGDCPFLKARPGGRGGEGRVFRLPVAHKEGRFRPRDAEVLRRLEAGRHVALRYATPAGAPATDYPANPNGSVGSIAGIVNAGGNVLGLMPHPERFLRFLQDPQWTRRRATGGLPPDEERAGEGFLVFENAVEHALEALV